jgi:nucleoside phosphorylase
MPRAVILTALPVEYLAVRSHLSDLQEEMHPQGTIYERGKFAANGQEWEVGVVETGAGNIGSAIEAERAIAYFKPDVLIFVGIAGGIKDVAIGDVVAATKVYGYESGKAGEQFLTRPALGQSAHALVQRAIAEARKEEWLQRLSNSPAPLPRVFVAPIAAGEKVVASRESELFKFLRASYNDAVAVEMEGFGFLSAAFAYPEIKAIVIRGISDLVEGKNDDSVCPEQVRQERASYHASAFAFELLAKFVVDEVKQQDNDRSFLRSLENKLNSGSYRPSQPTAKPAYLVDANSFQLMPLDIGTIWGLQRSSFIGLLIGFKETEIYENLKNVEFALSNAKKSNKSVTDLPKREWIQIDINRYPGVPCQKAQITDAAIDISSEVANNLENDCFPDPSILGFFFEIDVEQLHASYSEKIRAWCEALLNQLFPLQGVAIVINIVRSLDEDVERSVKTLKSKLQEIAEEIPVELMCLDARLFFATNLSSQKTGHTNFVNIEEKPGLAFCSWMYHAKTRSVHRENLDKGKINYIDAVDLYINLKSKYSEHELQDAYSGITARDVVLDLKAISPQKLQEVYEQLLKLIVDFFPQWSCEWVSAYAHSEFQEAVCAALTIATHANLLTDLLMDAWVDAINIDTFDIDLLCQNGLIAPDFDNINNLRLESLFLALLRREQTLSDKKIQIILQKLVLDYPSFMKLHHFHRHQKDSEDDFLNQNDPNQFTLAIRAKIRLNRVINQFKAAPFSHLPPAICWLLAAISPSQNNITELLQLEPIKRAVFGLCTPQEWQQIKRRQENERQVLDCRRDRLLIFTSTHL